MFRKLLTLALLSAVIVSIAAIEKNDVQSFQNTIIAKQKESFRNAKNLFRSLPNGGFRGYEIEEMVYQVYVWYREEWDNEYKIIRSYDDEGKLNGFELWEWEVEQPERRDPDYLVYVAEVEWTQEGFVDRIVMKFPGEDDELIEAMRYVHEYNDNNQVTSVVFHIMEDFNEWTEIMQISFIYDENDRVKVFLMEELIQEEEDAYRYGGPSKYRTSIEYDERGRIKETINDEEYNGEWEFEEKQVIDYHSSDEGDYSGIQIFVNNYTLNLLLDTTDYESPFGNVECETYYEYDIWYEEWIPYSREVTIYNEDNIPIRVEHERYYEEEDARQGEWELREREIYAYNDEDLLESIIFEWLDWSEPELWHQYSRTLFSYIYISFTGVEDTALPKNVVSIANYPNPFNPETTIVFNLQSPQDIELNVYNAKGQLVRQLTNGKHQAGEHRIVWDGKDNFDNKMSSGLYFYHLKHDDEVISGKMMMIK